MSDVPRPVVAIVAIAAVEGLGLVGYAAYSLVEAMRVGATGPSDVSNGPAIAVQIAIEVLFGAGMIWVALGWWRTRPWARAPFLVAQILGILIGFDLAQSEGAIEKVVGIGLIIIAAVGAVLVFRPAVSRRLAP